MATDPTILVLNCGSSSVKAAWFATEPALLRVGSGAVDHLDTRQARLRALHADGSIVRDEPLDVIEHEHAIDLLLTHVETRELTDPLVAVGHRLVHGGAEFAKPRIVDDALLDRLQTVIALAPMHLPHNLAGIAEVTCRWPDTTQVACFDTAFHQSLPDVARLLGLPQALHSRGIRRYGFHGLSYESIVDDLARHEGAAAIAGRTVVAHLGSGASMTALKDGKSIDTTMGFSALGGLLMGTRCGDIDPGALLYLLQENIVDIAGAQDLLYEKSGLLGVSGVSSNMRALLDQQDLPAVRQAIELFCHSARKHLAALTAVLGGLDRLVFTGGIGANSPEIRQRICADLSYLGVDLDPGRNNRQDRTISFPGSPVIVNTIHSDEELIIARHTYQLAIAPLSQAPR